MVSNDFKKALVIIQRLTDSELDVLKHIIELEIKDRNSKKEVRKDLTWRQIEKLRKEGKLMCIDCNETKMNWECGMCYEKPSRR